MKLLPKKESLTMQNITLKCKNPLVSLIIPVYNAENYLSDCLDSAISQSLKNIEIIAINDGSTDNSLNILREYTKKDGRIKIINQQNKGASSSRNKGIAIAKGEYLFFLDSDDTLNPISLEMLYKKAKETNSLLIIANYTRIESNGNKILRKAYITEDLIKGVLEGTIRVPIWNKFYQRKMILDNNFNFATGLYHEDNLSSLEIMFYTKDRVSILDYSIINYFERVNSITSSFTLKHTSDLLEIYDRISELLIKNNIYKKYFFYNHIFFINLFIHFLKSSKPCKDEKIINLLKKELPNKSYFGKATFIWLKKNNAYTYYFFIFYLLKYTKDYNNSFIDFLSRFIPLNDLLPIQKVSLKNQTLYMALVKYLVKNEINEVAIYGIGEFYQNLKKDLAKDNIKITSLIDKRAETEDISMDGIRVVDYKKALLKETTKVIIITAIKHSRKIKENLNCFIKEHNKNIKIIDIADIFNLA